jgi:hypothetical protein
MRECHALTRNRCKLKFMTFVPMISKNRLRKGFLHDLAPKPPHRP